MSDWQGCINKLQVKESVKALREHARSMIRDFKEIGFNREEAMAYLVILFKDNPEMIPLATIVAKREWNKVH